jgi:hypothetical protein
MNPEQPQIPTSAEEDNENLYNTEVERFKHDIERIKNSDTPIHLRASNLGIAPKDIAAGPQQPVLPGNSSLENHLTHDDVTDLAKNGSYVLDHPENFIPDTRVNKHHPTTRSIMDTPVAELNALVKLHPDLEFPVSGGDIAKIGAKRLKPVNPFLAPVPIYHIGTLSSRTRFVKDGSPSGKHGTRVDVGGSSFATRGAAPTLYTEDTPENLPRSTIFRLQLGLHLRQKASDIGRDKAVLDHQTAEATKAQETKKAAEAKAAAEKAYQDSLNDPEVIGPMLAQAHERGAHKGRKIADCPSC